MSLFDSASLIVTPNGYKEDKLYSIKPSDGSGDLVVTRATTATRVNSDGLIEQVPYNLLQYSQQFTNAIWTPRNGTFTDNFTTAPNGTTTACKWVATDTDPYIYQSYNGANVDYTATCWVKATGTAIGKNCSIRVGASAVFTAMTGEWQQLTITANINGSVNVGVEAPESATSGEIVYIWGFQLVEGTSAKEYFPTTDRLDVPRLDYTNSSCPSILVEGQRTNLYLGSEDFSLYYNKYQTSILSNTTISPSGLQNADSLIESTSNSTHHIENNFSATSDTSYTLSVFVKQNTRNQYKIFGFSDNGVFNSQIAIYDLVNGTIVSNTGGGIAKIENYGNGWFRCSLTLTSGATGTGYWAHGLSLNGNANYVGDGTSGVYIWGAQLEAGSYATSYIPTQASSVTRNADVISKTGISSLIGQTEGTMFVDFVMKNNISSVNRIISLTESSWISGGSIRIDIQSNNISVDFINNGASIGSIIYSNVFTQNTRYKIAIAYKTNDCALYMNGTQLGTNTSIGTMPTCSEIYLNELGGGFGGPYQATAFNQATLFKTRLTNTELAQLTTI